MIPSGPEERFQLTAAQVIEHWGENTRGVLLASPSNPTGTSILPDELKAILAEVRKRQGFAILDEITRGCRTTHRRSRRSRSTTTS
jgi:aspartate/methionine/tyrosine aminotransferase